MGLTCSLLGHAFEDTDVERDREEQGSEVVTIVREVETCRRCGESRTVSENKEVTTIVEPDDIGSSDEETSGSESTATPASDGQTDDDAYAGGTDAGAAFDPPDDPAEEDAEILEDDGETPREPGQWPDEQDDFEPTTLTSDRNDDGAAAEDAEHDAERAADEVATEANAGEADNANDAARSVEPAATSVPAGDYVCPECGFTTAAAESSLREGDSCPECRRGYLTAQ